MKTKIISQICVILLISMVSIKPLFGNNIGWSVDPEKIAFCSDYTIYMFPVTYDREQYKINGFYFPPEPEKKFIRISQWIAYMAAEKGFVHAPPLKAIRIRQNDNCTDKAGGVLISKLAPAEKFPDLSEAATPKVYSVSGLRYFAVKDVWL